MNLKLLVILLIIFSNVYIQSSEYIQTCPTNNLSTLMSLDHKGEPLFFNEFKIAIESDKFSINTSECYIESTFYTPLEYAILQKNSFFIKYLLLEGASFENIFQHTNIVINLKYFRSDTIDDLILKRSIRKIITDEKNIRNMFFNKLLENDFEKAHKLILNRSIQAIKNLLDISNIDNSNKEAFFNWLKEKSHSIL